MDRDVLAHKGLILCILIPSLIVFVSSFEYSNDGRIIPLITSLIVISGSLLLLVSEYLPDPIEALIDARSHRDEADANVLHDEIATAQLNETDQTHAKDDYAREFTMVSIVGYVIGSYMFSLIVVTPMFVGFYLWWRGHSPLVILLFASVLTLFAYSVMSLVWLPGMARGALVDFSSILLML